MTTKKPEPVQLPIDALKPYPKNARTHSKAQVELIAKSITKYGFLNPVLIDEKNMILAGHGRIEAGKLLGMKQIPCIQIGHLTDALKREYILADNRLAELAGWDLPMLSDELKALDMDFTELGFDQSFLREPKNPLTDEDAVPDVSATPVSKPGDVWLLGNHRVMCGDSTSLEDVRKLMDGELADMVFTDPPYGMSYGGGRAVGKSDGTVKGFGVIKGDDKRGDDLIDLVRDAIQSFYLSCKDSASWYVCFPWRTYSEFEAAVKPILGKPKSCIVWDKKSIGLGSNKGYRPQHEFIFYVDGGQWFGDKAQSDVWQMSRGATGQYVHPTQKPVELIERALENSSKNGDIVIDPFGGSGSTLIASEKNSRACRMMELDPKYCDVIVKRWQEYTGKIATNAETGDPFNG